MRFPAIGDVAAELRRINKQGLEPDDADEGIDVRLQVYNDGNWAVRWGLSDYDQDHRGYWGSSSVPGDNRRFDSKAVARDLIEQARENKASGGDDEDEDDLSESPAPRRAASPGDRHKTNTDANHFVGHLKNNVILVAGEAESIDLDDEDPIFVAIVVNVTGYGPHPGAIYAEQNRFHANGDSALEEAHEILEEWEREHYPAESEEDEEHRTETFDGLVWKLTPQEFEDAIRGTPAVKFLDLEDELGEDEEDEED